MSWALRARTGRSRRAPCGGVCDDSYRGLPVIRSFSMFVFGAALSVTCAAWASPIPTQQPPQVRRAFFGDLHLHTALSLDAWGFGTKLLPNDAYRFGRGETIMVPAVQAAVEQGHAGKQDVPAKRAWPLDFMAVTDHSESLGTAVPLDDPQSAFANSELGRKIIARPLEAFLLKMGAARGQLTMPAELRDPEVM